MEVFLKNDAWWIDNRYHKGKRHRRKVGSKKKAEDNPHLAPDHLRGAVERLDFSSGHYMDTEAAGDEKCT